PINRLKAAPGAGNSGTRIRTGSRRIPDAAFLPNSVPMPALRTRNPRLSGLIDLLDDVAAIAKVAAASVDDVVGQAAKAGAKAAGAVIDDAAVTPRYIHGFDASRELPIVWRIAKGSLKNKLLYLLPAALLL